MKATAYTLLFILTFLSLAPSSLRAQEQQPSQAQPMVVQQPASAQVSMDSMGVRRYLLGPGDTIDVRVFGQAEMNWTGEVDGDGNLGSLPFVQKPIKALCRTENDVAKDIREAYSKYIKDPQISVRVTGRNSRSPATVVGAVRLPQRFTMMRRVRLNELLALSGGMTEKANGKVEVIHTESLMCPEPGEDAEPVVFEGNNIQAPYKVYNIKELAAGNQEANPLIRPGDVIRVLEADPIFITGSVVSPQGLYLREGMTLSLALAMVGGVRKEGKLSGVIIYRVNPKANKRDTIVVDLEAIKKEQKPDVALQAYDIIEVPEKGTSFMRILANSVLNLGPQVLSTVATGLPGRVLY